MIIEGSVKALPNVSSTDGSNYTAIMGKQQEILVSELTGKYFTANYRSKVITASLTTATAMVAPATNATPNFIIWNPSGNNTAFVPIKMYFGYVSGTPAAAAVGFSYIPNAGSTLATSAPIQAFTQITARYCNGFAAYAGGVLFGSAATVTGTSIGAAAVLRWTPISQGAIPSASVAAGMSMVEDFDGNIIIPPNTALYPMTSAASVATYMISVVGLEVPWP